MKFLRCFLLSSLIIVVVLTSVGCSRTPDEIKEQIKVYREQEIALKDNLSNLESDVTNKSLELKEVKQELKVAKEQLDVYKHELAGGKVRYIFIIELKQSHVTLDLTKMMKDEMNAVTFEMHVDEEFYNSYNEGDELLSEFRDGSFLLEGSVGSWKLRLVDKKTELYQ